MGKQKRRMEENARKHAEETRKRKELDEYKPYRIERYFHSSHIPHFRLFLHCEQSLYSVRN